MTRRKPLAGRLGLYAFLASASLFFALPLYVMVSTSLKTMPEIREGSILSFPLHPDVTPWVVAWSQACIGIACEGIRVGFWNSLAILVPGVAFSVAVGALNGYALSLWRARKADALLFLLIAAGFIPYQVILYPLVKITSQMGVFGTLPGIVLIHTLFSLPILTLIFRNFYVSLPPELMKAARVDGAGFFQIFFRIILPMSQNIIVVALILSLTGVWNDYLLSLIFAGRANLPMTVELATLVGTRIGLPEYNVNMAATIITALPPLLLYLVSGRYFVRGITAGAVKG